MPESKLKAADALAGKRDALARRRPGPPLLPPAEKRDHCVSVRLHVQELADLDAARSKVKMQRGEYLRAASMGKIPPTIPEINREAWASLARLSSNLNQVQGQINAGFCTQYPPEIIQDLSEAVQILRNSLLGIDPKKADDEG